MSIEIADPVKNEYPDVVGAKPANPASALFRPYIAAETMLPELTARAVIVGTILGMVFGASSLYLVLKVGLTVSASIPVAVISIALFRALSKAGAKDATILENNIVQTAGSAGESIAFGVGVTMPAIMILGFDLELARVMLVAILGGLLGILMMIPLRRALIVGQHGVLKYPEGTACAEVLKAGAAAIEQPRRVATTDVAAARSVPNEQAASNIGAKIIFTGFGIGFLYQTAMVALRGWKDIPEKVFGAPFKAGSIAAEVSPALLGVGYIIGPRIASIMCAGGVLAYLVLIPAIKFFGEGTTVALAPGTMPISEMGPNDIRGAYILYIGAGAVAAGGVISLFRSLPTIWQGLKGGLQDIRGSEMKTSGRTPRTDQDLPMTFVLGGIILLIIVIMLARSLQMNLLGAVMIILFGVLFVTTSSRLTGEIGSTSNPISGMTVATLLFTCLIFLFVGWSGPAYFVTALSVGGIICIAAANAGTTSQDLKTGFLVGATPRLQQIAILVGALASAIILGPILLRLNETATVYVPRVTFEPVAASVGQPETGLIADLPNYVDDIKPAAPGTYRLLTSGPAAQTPPTAAPQVTGSQTSRPQASGPQAYGPQAYGLGPGDYLVNDQGRIAYKVQRHFPVELRADASELGGRETLRGPQATSDSNVYRVWHKTDTIGGPAGRYLVDDRGVPVYLVDPGINGTHRVRPDGSTVNKFDAPKATLVSYIIKGVLDRQLPWGLVLLGIMITVVLEMVGIPSLAFAVGVYLPLSTSSPILIGGLIRWLVDRSLRSKLKNRNLTEEELVAEGDKSPGVLMASGYIAGGAIAGILIAFMAGVLSDIDRGITAWSTAHNPLFAGENANVLSLIPFALLTLLLYTVGREWLLAERKG